MVAFYIATAWENRDAARELAGQLESMGHACTRDWWLEELSWDWNDSEKVARLAPGIADADLLGVWQADVFILLPSMQPQVGALVEFGAALFSVPTVIVVGGHTKNVFMWHPYVQHVSDIPALLGLAVFG